MEVLIKIDNEKYTEFKKVVKDFDAKIINSYPDEVVVSSIEEVRKRVKEAEERVKNGEYVNEDEFNKFIEKLINENS